MMIWKIKMMSGVEISIHGEDNLQRFLKEANVGKKLIVTEYGIVNVSSIDSITIDKEKLGSVDYLRSLGKSWDNALLEVLGVSPFAKFLAPKKEMLSPQSRTVAQEESSKDDRQKLSP